MSQSFFAINDTLLRELLAPASGWPKACAVFAPFGPVKSPRDWGWMNGTFAHAVVGPFEKPMEALRTSWTSGATVLPTRSRQRR
jgi:hypothetical protein